MIGLVALVGNHSNYEGPHLMQKPIKNRSCPNLDCALNGQFGKGNIIRHSFIPPKRCKRRRYRCKGCGKTFCSTTQTPYYRIKHTRKSFDEVVTMSVEGINKSSIARIKRLSWNTVARWQQRAAAAARRFNDMMMEGYEIKELQADEIRSFIMSKENTTWVMVVMEVWSRLWSSTVVGRTQLSEHQAVVP